MAPAGGRVDRMITCAEPKDCKGCGACCDSQGVPPITHKLDRPRIPAELLAEIDASWSERAGKQMPCLWFNVRTGECQHYEYRPEVCRQFVLAGERCMKFRREHPTFISVTVGKE